LIRVVTVIQARTGSSRLPGKVLLPAVGKPLLALMIERVRRASRVGTVVLATTSEPEDRPIADLGLALGVDVYRGHPTDCLDRHVGAARQRNAEVVVKIPSDCPLIDPGVIDRVLSVFLDDPDRYEYVSNLHPESYPDGNDVEVVSLKALEAAWSEARRPFEREHTTPFIWDQPDRFRIGSHVWDTGLDLSQTYRWVLDYPEDYELIRTVYERLTPVRPDFGLDEILALMRGEPGLAEINRKHIGTQWYRHFEGELRTLSAPGPIRADGAER
jgi:spore coat polysaccharide biosynthesis protein SpsF